LLEELLNAESEVLAVLKKRALLDDPSR